MKVLLALLLTAAPLQAGNKGTVTIAPAPSVGTPVIAPTHGRTTLPLAPRHTYGGGNANIPFGERQPAFSQKLESVAEDVGREAESIADSQSTPDEAQQSGQQVIDALFDVYQDAKAASFSQAESARSAAAGPAHWEGIASYEANAASAREALGADPASAKTLHVFSYAEGNATLVELGGKKWVRKYWPASREAAFKRVQNELFYTQLVASTYASSFEVTSRSVAMPDGKGGYFYFTRYVEDAKTDSARYETGLDPRQRAKLAALRFVWGLADAHAKNVLFTRSAKPLLIDFEMAGDNSVNGENRVFDRSAMGAPKPAAVSNTVYIKQQPYLAKKSPVPLSMEPYQKEVDRARALLEDPEFLEGLRRMMRRARFSDEEAESYLAGVRSNIDNFARNFKPYLDKTNEIIKERRKNGFR